MENNYENMSKGDALTLAWGRKNGSGEQQVIFAWDSEDGGIVHGVTTMKDWNWTEGWRTFEHICTIGNEIGF